MHRCFDRSDADRVAQTLEGIGYPAAKWQLIMQAEEYGADTATRAGLWALPAGSYEDLEAVMAALAAVVPQVGMPQVGRYRPPALRSAPVAGRVRPLR